MRLMNSAPDCVLPGCCDPAPLDRATWSGIVSGNHARLGFRLVLKLLVDLFQIPATDLNVPFRIAQEALRIAGHLPFEFRMPVSVAHSRPTVGVTCIRPISPSLPVFHGLKYVSS